MATEINNEISVSHSWINIFTSPGFVNLQLVGDLFHIAMGVALIAASILFLAFNPFLQIAAITIGSVCVLKGLFDITGRTIQKDYKNLQEELESTENKTEALVKQAQLDGEKQFRQCNNTKRCNYDVHYHKS